MIHFLTSRHIGLDWQWNTLCGIAEDHLALWDSTTDVNTFFRHDERCQECENHPEFSIILLEAV